TLDELCTEARAILKNEPMSDALGHIAERLGRLLSNPAFVGATFSDDMPPRRRVRHPDPETGFYLLAHLQESNNTGKPHSHGSSWAIRMAPHQPGERGGRRSPAAEQVPPWAWRDQSLWPGRDPFDRAPEEGLGDPRHRHRSRRAPALSFRQARSHACAGLS